LQDNDKTIVRILLQVAYALGWMHSLGYVHMDVKSPNIMVDMSDPSKPKAMLADLGTAQYSESYWFDAGVGTGTPLW
jgi:serine/threonine protein kinase